jgi:hydroxymethylbilane synthase
MPIETRFLSVASRGSPLAIVQVKEVLNELKMYHHNIEFTCHYVETIGDKDQTTSLRTLNKTDFFTKEIDEMILERTCRIAIHSAKDLPEPLPKGLYLAALTKGVDSSDSLILKPGQNLSTLPDEPVIATSSERREEAVKELIPHARFVDLRGTIHQRIQKLDQKNIDGVVVAEAAIIRLDLTSLNRVQLPGDTTPLQGQLAVIVREDDQEMRMLFSCIDSRQQALVT